MNDSLHKMILRLGDPAPSQSEFVLKRSSSNELSRRDTSAALIKASYDLGKKRKVVLRERKCGIGMNQRLILGQVS